MPRNCLVPSVPCMSLVSCTHRPLCPLCPPSCASLMSLPTVLYVYCLIPAVPCLSLCLMYRPSFVSLVSLPNAPCLSLCFLCPPSCVSCVLYPPSHVSRFVHPLSHVSLVYFATGLCVSCLFTRRYVRLLSYIQRSTSLVSCTNSTMYLLFLVPTVLSLPCVFNRRHMCLSCFFYPPSRVSCVLYPAYHVSLVLSTTLLCLSCLVPTVPCASLVSYTHRSVCLVIFCREYDTAVTSLPK